MLFLGLYSRIKIQKRLAEIMLQEKYSKIKMNKRKDKVENMQKKMERKTLVAVEREREREREPYFKNQ